MIKLHVGSEGISPDLDLYVEGNIVVGERDHDIGYFRKYSERRFECETIVTGYVSGQYSEDGKRFIFGGFSLKPKIGYFPVFLENGKRSRFNRAIRSIEEDVQNPF